VVSATMSAHNEPELGKPLEERMEDSENQKKLASQAVVQEWETANYNPQNWPRWKQAYHIFVPAILGFVSWVEPDPWNWS
jgi:hypothetical protein